MKRFHLAVVSFIGICLIMASCSSHDKNVAVVKKEFKNYVQKTFDNPKELKEIVEIIPSDTLSTDKLKSILDQAAAVCDLSYQTFSLADSLSTKDIQLINLDTRKTQSASYSTRYQIESLLNRMIGFALRAPALKRNVLFSKDQLLSCKDSLKYEPPIYEYTVSYRVKKGDIIKLESSYAYLDSLEGFKKILPIKMTKDDYSEQMQDAFRIIDNAKNNYEELDSFRETIVQNSKELQSLLLPYSK